MALLRVGKRCRPQLMGHVRLSGERDHKFEWHNYTALTVR